MTRSIVILSGSHLCHNPRVLKEATALANAGFSVEVLGAWFDSALRARDRELVSQLPFTFTPVLDLTQNALASFGCRARAKLGQLTFRFAGWQNQWQFGYAVSALQKAARERLADLYIAHSEAALIAATDLQRAGRRVGVDMEDWFSEDLMPLARSGRPVRLLRDLERGLLRSSLYSSCPSQAMSDALAKEFECRAPTVVYNAFAWSERSSLDGLQKDRGGSRRPSLHWYSQTLGPGRGLEDLFAALPHVKHKLEIHLRGKPGAGFEEWVQKQVTPDWRSRIIVHNLVPNHELLSRISEHDIGFAGEMTYCRSRDLTVTNKILHYLLGGLAIVASDTAGQREIADQAYGAVHVYAVGRPDDLAAQLNRLLDSVEILRETKMEALRAAESTFCWERIAPRLVQSVELALAQT